MTDYCKIGMISVSYAHLIDGDSHAYVNEIKETNGRFRNLVAFGNRGRSEKISILCTNLQARQIIGLSNWRELIWIDSAVDLSDESDYVHRGWYIAGDPEVEPEGIDMAIVKLELRQISPNPNEFLNMNYSVGNGDGTTVASLYNLEEKVDYLSDTFSSFDTTNTWYSPITNNMTSGAISSASGKLQFSGGSNKDGYGGYVFTCSKNTYQFPKTFEFDLEYVTKPSGYEHRIGVYFLPLRPQTNTEFNNITEYLRVLVTAKTGDVWFQRYSNGSLTTLYHTVLSSTQKAPTFKLEIDSNKYATLYLDKNGGTNYSKVYGASGTGLTFSTPYVALVHWNQDSTTATTKMNNLNIYNNEAIEFNNIVALPVTDKLTINETFTRDSEDGDIPCYVNPSIPLKFKIDPDNYYKGSLNAQYYFDNEWHRITDINTLIEVNASPLFYISNSLIKLGFKTTGVVLSYWNGTSWSEWGTLGLGTVDFIKPRIITSEVIQIQVENTLWTLRRGKKFVHVEHPLDSITFTKRTNYYHNNGSWTTTTSPADNSDIDMSGFPYCNIWNDGDEFALQVIKTDPTSIKSDSIPSSALTGIAVYDTSISDVNSYEHNSNLYKEFFVETKQKIGLRRL